MMKKGNTNYKSMSNTNLPSLSCNSSPCVCVSLQYVTFSRGGIFVSETLATAKRAARAFVLVKNQSLGYCIVLYWELIKKLKVKKSSVYFIF